MVNLNLNPKGAFILYILQLEYFVFYVPNALALPTREA